jgi:hypothetical protein
LDLISQGGFLEFLFAFEVWRTTIRHRKALAETSGEYIMKRSHFSSLLCSLAIVLPATNALFAQQSDSKVSSAIKTTDSSAASPALFSAPLSDLYINQWIHSDKDRNIGGSVVALVGKDTISLAKVRVSLVRNGIAEFVDDTDIDGDFLIEGVSPGVFTLVAETADSLALFSLTVLDEVSGKHLPNKLQVRLMPTSNRSAEIIRGQTLPKEMVHATPEMDPLQAVRKFNDSHMVVIDSSGNINGQLSRANESVDMSTMTVFVMRDGSEVSRVRVTSDGRFVIRGVAAGCYGLIAAGEAGLAATGFCATTQELAKQASEKEIRVSFNMKPSTTLNIELGDPVGKSASEPTDDVVVDDTGTAAAMGAYGMGAGNTMPYYGGGGGGGGFGAGGRGGFGSLAAIGGLIAAGVILATDDEEVVTSPIAP